MMLTHFARTTLQKSPQMAIARFPSPRINSHARCIGNRDLANTDQDDQSSAYSDRYSVLLFSGPRSLSSEKLGSYYDNMYGGEEEEEAAPRNSVSHRSCMYSFASLEGRVYSCASLTG